MIEFDEEDIEAEENAAILEEKQQLVKELSELVYPKGRRPANPNLADVVDYIRKGIRTKRIVIHAGIARGRRS